LTVADMPRRGFNLTLPTVLTTSSSGVQGEACRDAAAVHHVLLCHKSQLVHGACAGAGASGGRVCVTCLLLTMQLIGVSARSMVHVGLVSACCCNLTTGST
jgi:hypothetical protein